MKVYLNFNELDKEERLNDINRYTLTIRGLDCMSVYNLIPYDLTEIKRQIIDEILLFINEEERVRYYPPTKLVSKYIPTMLLREKLNEILCRKEK